MHYLKNVNKNVQGVPQSQAASNQTDEENRIIITIDNDYLIEKVKSFVSINVVELSSKIHVYKFKEYNI